jgi:nucleotide-binding universal stress UspA family protein
MLLRASASEEEDKKYLSPPEAKNLFLDSLAAGAFSRTTFLCSTVGMEKGGIKMEVKKLLWPTDFSGNAAKALGYVASLTEKYQTEVHLLYVIEDVAHHESWYGEFGRTHIDKIQEWEKKEAKKRLDQICDKYLRGAPLYIKHIAIGDPAKEILLFIEKEQVDMVVMATHGRGGHFPFGSVTEKIVKNSSVPVVTIPISR